MPYKRNGKLIPGDPRNGTRWATKEEVKLAAWALTTLDNERSIIGTAPAPEPHYQGHKIRVVESSNPEWYREFGLPYWRGREFNLIRGRVEGALKRVRDKKVVRRNGHEVDVLKFLLKWREEHKEEMEFYG